MIKKSLVALAAIASLHTSPTVAQDYPARAVQIIVPFAAGGGPDISARSLATVLAERLKQSFVVENRPGANGVTGTQLVANAKPDGYTLLGVSSSFAVNPSTQKNLPYDPVKDLVAVAELGRSSGYLLVVNASSPIKSVEELIAASKTGDVRFGSPGVGNSNHLVGEVFAAKSGAKMKHIPYKGAGEVVTALLSNEIQAMFTTPFSVTSFIKSGRLRAIGFIGEKRFAELPDIALVSDTVPGFKVASSWHGIFAPAGTPPAVVEKLNAEIRSAVKTEEVKKVLLAAGYDPADLSAPEFGQFVQEEIAGWGEAVKAAGLSAK